MKLRNTVAFAILIALGLVCAGTVKALYTSLTNASTWSYPEALNDIPSDYQFIFGMNVREFVTSSGYERVVRQQKVGGDLLAFTERTGLDPKRDIFYLVGAGRAKEQSSVLILTGRFDRAAISSYIRSKSAPEELQYGGTTVMMIPDSKSGALEKGIAFLGGSKIAVGDLKSLKMVLDNRGNANRSILSNEIIAPLIEEIGPDQMLWFAGDASGVLKNAPITTPMPANISTVKTIMGTINIGDALTGEIKATAYNEESAAKLAEALKGFIALGQIAGSRYPELKTLLEGISITQDSARVSMVLNLRLDLLEKLNKSRKSIGGRQADVSPAEK